VKGEKKHGEVSSPTQVRYDIVIFIGPVFIITALGYKQQGTCHFRKHADKQAFVHFLTEFKSGCPGALLPICTRVLLICTGG
jgi:hypothetical protein